MEATFNWTTSRSCGIRRERAGAERRVPLEERDKDGGRAGKRERKVRRVDKGRLIG